MFSTNFNIADIGKGKTFIHRLQPAVKVSIAIIAIIINAQVANPFYSLSLICIFLILLLFAQINFKIFFKFYLIIIYMILGMGIGYAIFLGLSVKLVFTLWMNLTSMAMPVFFLMFTSPILQTLYGLEFVMYPLNYLKLPVNAIILICTIALSFIPILVTEVQRILNAMAVRGRDIRYVPIKEKVKIAISVLIPLLVSTINRCETLGSAIAVKNYDAWSPRTNILTAKWKAVDTIFLVAILSLYYVSYHIVLN